MEVVNLTVVVYPQPGEGVLVRIRGNDQAGVCARQSEFAEWAEGLPKRGVAEWPSEAETREMKPAQRHANGAEATGEQLGPGRG